MSNIADGDVSTLESVGETHGRLGGAFDIPAEDQSAPEHLASAAQRLAALGQMTGGIAHDFRNILAIIESGLTLAEKNSEQPDGARIYIAAAREAVNRGLKLTSQLLSFAKQQELEAHAGNANDFLRNLEVFLKYGAGPGIRIMSELAPDIPMCLIDPAQFNAAILNLVLNARDAMPNGGDIRISTMRCVAKSSIDGSLTPGLYVQVQVKDTGQGMSAETAQKIFDPFFTTKGENGTGLGLPQVRAFMRLIGGHVRVASEPGIGTAVDLLFPAVQSHDVAETHDDASETARQNEL
jgi:signal transduction histidine kinase